MQTPQKNDPLGELKSSPLVCCSFADRAELEAIEPVGDIASAILRDAGGNIDRAKASLIEAVRNNKHVELRTKIIAFRQKDGAPNKNFLRFKSSKLADIGASFAGRPFLLDHNTYSQTARMGTILESEAVPLAGGWTGFRQTLHVVKPHGVISVLDGTLDQFSIGWDAAGPVICTAHNVDVRSRKSCYWTEGCYPGKLVEVDGEQKIAEYEWQSTSGKETSGVNSPAVTGTKIEDVKAALAAELGLAAELFTHDENEPKAKTMKFPLLMSALAISVVGELSETDDAKLAERAKEIADAKLAAEQERDNAVKTAGELSTKVAELEAQVSKLEGGKVDELLADAYKAGKLIRAKDKDGKSAPSPRETRLRKIAKLDGVEALSAELAEMPVVVPVGRAELSDEDPNPRPSTPSGPLSKSVLASTAKQLGLDATELETHANQITGRDSSGENN